MTTTALPMSPTSAQADAALADLRRHGLIRVWETDPDTDLRTITVGRGNIRPLADQTPAGTLALAETLRRNAVTITGPGYPMGHRTTRYHLSDGRFLDRNDSRTSRHFDQYPYSTYLPGGSSSGSAEVHFGARTLKEALALAGLKRVMGRCRNCDSLRPVHVDEWMADPRISCPACEAPATGEPLAIPCRWCPLDVEQHSAGDYLLRTAWRHLNGVVACDRGPLPGTFNRPSAQPR